MPSRAHGALPLHHQITRSLTAGPARRRERRLEALNSGPEQIWALEPGIKPGRLSDAGPRPDDPNRRRPGGSPGLRSRQVSVSGARGWAKVTRLASSSALVAGHCTGRICGGEDPVEAAAVLA